MNASVKKMNTYIHIYMGFDPGFERPTCYWRVLIERNSLSVDDNIYAPPWGLSTLVKEFSATARILQNSSKELSTLVADRV